MNTNVANFKNAYELNMCDLNNVSGGVVPAVAIVGGIIVGGGLGFGAGYGLARWLG